MKFTVNDFDRFWEARGSSLNLRNAERFRKSLRESVAECGSTAALDDHVLSLTSRKETTRRVIAEFYRFIGVDSSETVLYDLRFFDYPFERQLEIAKFLHTPRTTGEIQERFCIDERTARQDLQALEDGISVLGSTISIKKEKQGRAYRYRTTLHPVFLPLNLTEVYALTVYLSRVIKDSDVNSDIIRGISGRIKAQLSDYAFGRLFPGEERGKGLNAYVDDEQLARERKGILMYLMKSGEPCRFFWRDEEYVGRVGYCGGEYVILLNDGSVLDAPLDEVDFVTDTLNYV